MADHIDSSINQRITNANLTNAYKDICAIFKRYEMSATFAFVSALTLSNFEFKRYEDLFRDVNTSNGNWLRHFRQQIKDSGHQGWFVPESLSIVEAEGIHEIGSHGFSHLPVGDPRVDEKSAKAELEAINIVAKDRNQKLTTFIFPRNMVAHVDALLGMGFAAYRTGRYQATRAAKYQRFLSEFNIFGEADPHSSTKEEIPPSQFLNWRSGARGMIPVGITIKRWQSIIDDAIDGNKVAHIWLHPHNVIQNAGTLWSREQICSYAASKRDKGEMDIVTQEEYARSFHSNQ